MPERVEKHGDVHVVVGQPKLDVSAGEVCSRCGQVVQEHHFLWPRPDRDMALRLFVEVCYCGVRFTDPGDQPLDETPELWGLAGQSSCSFCGFKTSDRNAYLTHSCADILDQRGVRRAGSIENAP